MAERDGPEGKLGNLLTNQEARSGVPSARTSSTASVAGPSPAARRRLTVRSELALAALPTVTVLGMLLLLEVLSSQRLLFASLASSAFLIYLDPLHAMNSVRTLLFAHVGASCLGIAAWFILGHGYTAGAIAMAATIVYMILLDTMHPPAISTSLVFAINRGTESQFWLFLLALLIVATLVVLQRAAVWLFARLTRD